MRKWIVLVIVFLVASLGSLYLFIPNNLSIKQRNHVFFPAKAFTRALFNEESWQKWWPHTGGAVRPLHYNGNTYYIRDKSNSSFRITITRENDTLDTELFLIPVEQDSIDMEWLGAISSSFNPIRRIEKNRWVEKVSDDMAMLLQKMKAFYTNPDNLYTLPVRETKVVDSTLISTSTTVKGYPTTALIYGLINKLTAHANRNNARQTGLPMLNISEGNDNNYQVRVALPIDKKLKDEGDIHYRWMLGGGNILVTEVTGGPHQVKKAFLAMQDYINDFKRVAPAIPFESLVTDRRAEPDTSRWVTKVYWPVM